MKSNRISIALCTFNGERYLKEQLDSILMQTALPSEIVVCDDGSQDHTLLILENYKKTASIPIRIYKNERSQGVVSNFAQCIELCEGPYVALCDQDDIWKANKLEVLLAEMKLIECKTSPIRPVLIHSDLEVVDETGQRISRSFFRFQHLENPEKEPLKTLLVQNYVTGCTCLMNRPLIERALPMPKGVIMHDWWLALIAACTGVIGFVSVPTIMYRQHEDNVVGAKGFFSSMAVRKLCNWQELVHQVHCTVEQACLVSQRLTEFGEEIPVVLERFLGAMKKKQLQTWRGIIQAGTFKQGLLRNIVFFLVLWSYSSRNRI